MTRDECWMTFSEALESYLDNRDMLGHYGAGGHNHRMCKEHMEVAKQHMDALTSKETE